MKFWLDIGSKNNGILYPVFCKLQHEKAAEKVNKKIAEDKKGALERRNLNFVEAVQDTKKPYVMR